MYMKVDQQSWLSISYLFKYIFSFMLPVQVKKQVIYGEKYINGFCTAGKVTICHKVWVFMAYKMQSECLETKK